MKETGHTRLSVAEDVAIARQIADALDAAQRKRRARRSQATGRASTINSAPVRHLAGWQQFHVVTPPREVADPPELVVIQHWNQELEARLANK